jgi:glycosyltransferase involved in cell wall biosynthesis
MRPERISVCYAAPGHHLLQTSGSTRNVLSLAEALSEWADVTVAFRNIRESIPSRKYQIVEIEPQAGSILECNDDVAARGLNPLAHLSHLRAIRAFAQRVAGLYDVVLEKGWRLSGCLSRAFSLRGTASVLVENDVRCWSEPLTDIRTVVRYTLHGVSQQLAGYYSRRVPMVIAETDELKQMLIQHRGIASDRLEVVGLGVDHKLFRPMEKSAARHRLGIDPTVFLLLYVGGMDCKHDLGPVIDALGRMEFGGVELHLVGDGQHRPLYEERAGRQAATKFYGHVPHHMVPTYIAAADLCIAPYRADAFHGGQVALSTLKIPEYMACGRPVVSIPSGHVKKLIQHDVSGFLFPNEVDHWASFLRGLPERDHLIKMGKTAEESVAQQTWERTAARYLEICQRAYQSFRTKAAEEVTLQKPA